MKTGAIFLKALVIGGFALSAANFSPEAQAATPLTAANKTTLDSATAANVQAAITSMLAAAPAADREQLAKDIVAHYGGQSPSTGLLKAAVQTAVALLPGKAPVIAASAAQAVAGRPGISQVQKGQLMGMIMRGVASGAPAEFTAVRDQLIAALPTFQTAFESVAPPSQTAPPVLPDGSNPFVTSPS